VHAAVGPCADADPASGVRHSDAVQMSEQKHDNGRGRGRVRCTYASSCTSQWCGAQMNQRHGVCRMYAGYANDETSLCSDIGMSREAMG
jgi:hypothetical protein